MSSADQITSQLSWQGCKGLLFSEYRWPLRGKGVPGGISVQLLYRAWLGFFIWALAVVLWLQALQGELFLRQMAVLGALFLVVWFFTRQAGVDPRALALISVLVFLGWAFLTRLDPSLGQGHLRGALLGGVFYVFGLMAPPHRWPFSRFWAGIALGLLGVTALWGESAGGARAWLNLAGLRFQPVELAKVLLVVYGGKRLAQGASWEVATVLAGVGLLLLWQRDLGPALLLFLVFSWLVLHMDFAWYKLLGALVVVSAACLAAVALFPHVEGRVLAWLSPWNYLESKGYQMVQGLFALRAGGLVGQGLGQGLVHVIPHGHTDYILAIIGEELGFFGVCAVLLCYLGLAFWAVRILNGLEGEKQLVGLGLTLLLHGQVFLVVGGILRFWPYTGMTLPFVSFGSTSLVCQFWMLGLVAGSSRGGGEG